jgi:putative hydrolase of the HAD superfamily
MKDFGIHFVILRQNSLKMTKIKNLIFDLGNVIIDLDMERTFAQLRHYLGADYEASLKNLFDKDIFIEYEIGNISENEFLHNLRAVADVPVGIGQLRDAWNAMLLDIPFKRLEMLERLKQKYQVFLLSNTNDSHLYYVHGYLKTIYGIENFEERFFHRPYYSHLLGLRKPNRDIYEFVLKDAHLKADETMFFDDLLWNVKSAQSVGIQAVLHPAGTEIVDILRDF